MKWLRFVFNLLALHLLVACGGGVDVAPPEDSGNGGIEIGQVIVASQGGEVQSASGAAVLNIPANALPADTRVTLTVQPISGQPNQQNLGSQVYDIGPSNVDFLSPVTLTLTLHTAVPAGQLAFIGLLEGDSWQLLPQSVANDTSVWAQLNHFSQYAIVFAQGSLIVAEQGGVVQTQSGNAALTIPANALAQDTRMTVEVVEAPVASDDDGDDAIVISSAYRFSPDIDLLAPATVSLRIEQPVPEGQRAMLAKFDDDEWEILYQSVTNGDIVSVSVDELETWALVLTDIDQPVTITAIGPVCDPLLSEQTISFVHVADLHANYHRDNRFAKIKAYHHSVLAANPYTLFTDGGDDYEKGSIAEPLSGGVATMAAIHAMQFDARVIGNHDFAWGESQLLSFAQDPHGKVLLSNTEYIGNAVEGFGAVAYTEFQLGCVRVGMFGMVTEPWNEFDEQYEGDFLPSFKMDWDLDDIAQLMVQKHRHNVDVMVMLSHLGIGADNEIAEDVDGIDVVLGGHTHGGASIGTDSNNTIVIQPDFSADGVTQLDIQYNLQTASIAGHTYKEQLVSELTAIDSEVDTAINNILAQYAPNADTPIAVVENTITREQVPLIAGLAGMYAHQADAALLDPEVVWTPGQWSVGDVSAQQLNNAYRIERQLSDTPGTNAMYVADVSGDTLIKMKQLQPLWSYQGPVAPNNTQDYKVLLHKAAALNPLIKFGEGVDYKAVAFGSESYWALEQYGRNRTSDCKYFDSETALQSCQREQMRSVWTFSDSANPFKTDKGPGALSYRDPGQTGWGEQNTVFGMTTELGLPDLPDGPTHVMGFSKTTTEQGYTVTHNVPANGDFESENLVSDYTLVMDILWPVASDGQWRSMLQTTLDNSDEGEWFTENQPSGGIGLGKGYFGALAPNSWHRIAMVMYAAPELAGQYKMFIDGQLVGSGTQTDKRWALQSAFHLFTDNNNETQAGFVSAILFAGWPMTVTEIAILGGASSMLNLNIAR